MMAAAANVVPPLSSSSLLTIVDTALLGFGFSALIFLLLKVYWWNPASIQRKLRQQGLKVFPYQPILGNSKDIGRLQAEQAKLPHLDSASNHDIVPRLMPFYTKAFSEFGGSAFVFWWGSQPRLVVTKPEDVKHIMSTDFKDFMKSKTSYRIFHRLFGGGLLLADGEDWQNQRNLVRPAFFSDKLKGMVADMYVSAVEMTTSWDRLVKEAGQSAEVEVAYDLKNATADILARTCFGTSYRGGKEVFEKQVLLLPLLLKHTIANIMIPGYRFLPTPSNLECWKLERSIDKHLREIVESRMKSLSNKGAASTYGTDLLGLILADEDDKKKNNIARLTTQQIMDECKTFFFAGHETTANLLAWTMMLLALHPEWQEQARAEVLEVCGGKEAEPKADQLNKLRLMGMILNESLRLYPPAPELGPRVRTAPDQQNFKLGELSLPQGMGFSIPVLLIHRDKELWGKDADEFRPERFSDGASKACKHPYGFLPFGVGPRTCIGQSFAIMEAKVIMATILQRFRFRLSPNYRHAPETAITMRPKHGMQIILECV